MAYRDNRETAGFTDIRGGPAPVTGHTRIEQSREVSKKRKYGQVTEEKTNLSVRINKDGTRDRNPCGS